MGSHRVITKPADTAGRAHPAAARPVPKPAVLGVIAAVALVDRVASVLSRRSTDEVAAVVALPRQPEPARREQRAA